MTSRQRLLPILSALRRAAARDLAGIFQANNLLFLVLLGKSGEALFLMLGLLLLVPLSADPLARIPPARMAIWPLTAADSYILRIASMAFHPVVWASVLILLKTRQLSIAFAFAVLAIGMQAALALRRRMVNRDPHWDLLFDLPQLPGPLGGLLRKDIRETLSLLDPYFAALLSLGTLCYRIFARHPDATAWTIMALIVSLAMSTTAQSLFGLDGETGLIRYRLLPLRGWQILLAKGLAFLLVLFVLLLPLDVGAGMTFGLVSLAIGHHWTVTMETPERRWRFAAGNLTFGALQVAASMVCGFLEHQRGPLLLAAAAIGYVGSVWYYGNRWEREA